jgi:hypothetical protein
MIFASRGVIVERGSDGRGAKEILFLRFCLFVLLRIKIRVAGFFEKKQEWEQISFANRMSIYRVAALSLCRGD